MVSRLQCDSVNASLVRQPPVKVKGGKMFHVRINVDRDTEVSSYTAGFLYILGH
jgi:hypothetical protein